MTKVIESGTVTINTVGLIETITTITEPGAYALKLFLDYDPASDRNNVTPIDKFKVYEGEPWDETDLANGDYFQTNRQTIGEDSDAVKILIPKPFEFGVRYSILQFSGVAPLTIPYKVIQL